MSDRNSTLSSLGSRNFNSGLVKSLSQPSLLASDLAEKMLHIGAVSELAEQLQEQQRTQGELIRAALHPPFLAIGKPQCKRAGNSVREAKQLRQENSDLSRQLRRHQRPMLPSNQPGDGEVWLSLR